MGMLMVMDKVVVFPSELGWMAIVGRGDVLRALTFGHASADRALRSLDRSLLAEASQGPWNRRLVQRLQAYADGAPDDFRDVAIDPGPLGEFPSRVVSRCRGIDYGKTLTYGQLAAEAGRPRAARAVGNCMARNRIALVVPCHRVVRAGGLPGCYSAPGSTRMKQRLLAMECR
jgi:methylated-DNA-[protein]-cysteine S-methyltransferase